MAIKINGTIVVENSRRGVFRLVNLGTYSNTQFDNKTIRGKAVGDTGYNKDKQHTMSWLGSTWTNSVAGMAESVDSFSSTSSFHTPTNCSTVSAIPSKSDNIAGLRNSSVDLNDGEKYTFLSVLKFDDPDKKMWTSWSNEADDTYINLIGKRSDEDFPDSTYPDGYSQKQLTVTGDDGDQYYINDSSDDIFVNWKTLSYGTDGAFNALNLLFQTPEFSNLRVSRVSGNFDINYDEENSRYYFERAYYNEFGERVDKENIVIVDANGDPVDNQTSQTRENSIVHLGFLGSAKNGDVFELIEAKKEVGYKVDQTLSWECPEGKSLVGFFYVVKHPVEGINISQALKINPDEVDRASYLRGQEGVGNVIECKPGVNLNITIGDFNKEGMLEYYPSPEDTTWSIRYAVWSVSN